MSMVAINVIASGGITRTTGFAWIGNLMLWVIMRECGVEMNVSFMRVLSATACGDLLRKRRRISAPTISDGYDGGNDNDSVGEDQERGLALEWHNERIP
jgi:hypothetical protein